MTDPIISVRNIRKVFRVGEIDVEALQGVNLEVPRGEFLAVVGPSGSGKSTMFHILGGLSKPTSGEVIIDGNMMSGMSQSELTNLRKKFVGFVFQKYNLLPTLSANDNIEIARTIAHTNGEPRDPWFLEILDMLGIAHRLHHSPKRFPAANSSEWPSHGLSSTIRRSCWLTSPPAISIRRTPMQFSACCAS